MDSAARQAFPQVGHLDAPLRVTTTQVCGTDAHILKGEYPVARGFTIGHEPVGAAEELGIGQRVIAGATHAGWACHACLVGDHSHCGGKPISGWRISNAMDGCQAEYVLIPDAMAHLVPIPDGLRRASADVC